MEKKNLDKEVLVSLYKNAHIALQSISDIITETTDEPLKTELGEQYDGYEKYIGKLSQFMKETSTETKDINPFKKAMLFTSVKMNTLMDNSTSKIAELMIKGTVMGITELHELLNGSGAELSEKTLGFAKELTALEEDYEERLKKFL